MRDLCIVVTGCLLILSTGVVVAGPASFAEIGAKGSFVFVPERSMLTQEGGIAGIHEVYPIQGQFQLTVDLKSRTASLGPVDANLSWGSSFLSADANVGDLFHMSELTGTIKNDTTIEFEGRFEWDIVFLTLSLTAEGASLTGGTLCWQCVDCFTFDIEAVAAYAYGGGRGEPNDPYLIYTAEQMDAIGTQSDDWDKCFTLMTDIDLGGYTGNQFHVIGINWWGGFSGVFDGNGRTISHFTYTCVDVNCIKLFGVVGEKARIQNLGLIDPNISVVRGYYVGSLAGDCSGTITNCYVKNATVSAKHHVGGLFGSAGKLSNCHATGTVTGVHNVGGLSGYTWGTVTCCSATAKVTGNTEVGGLTGWNNGRLGGCFSAGSAVGDTGVGGLVGSDDLVISNCYTTCDVNAQSQAGGLVGDRAWDCTTANCYSAGKVQGNRYTGGLIGMDCAQMVGIPDTIRACFWDTQASGRLTSDGGTGLSTAQMQTVATFLGAGWDFVDETANGSNDLWRMPGRRGYPRLSWEQLPVEEPNAIEPEPPLPADDFEDGQAAPLWTACESADDVVRLKEVSGRLEVQASAPMDDSLALYLSDGWRLNATEDFGIKIDFHFGKRAVGEGRVLIGLTPNPGEPVTQWVALEAGCSNNAKFHRCVVRDGYAAQSWNAKRSSDDGILYISYDSVADELYLSNTGYGKADAMRTLAGVLKGRWQTESVCVILGGGSTGMTLKDGEAWLDNFAVDSGVVVR